MNKNILIFSDGTGQLGGLKPDQRLSNVYKMYRAMRPGTDSPIDPARQVAFYDPGLGTGEYGFFSFRKVRNILSSAFGTGISENIVDCYEAIIKFYEPGDRIFLFGFSRGAYTARCVANVLNLCGVPLQMPDRAAVSRHGPPLRRIAEETVYKVYEHGSGKARADYEVEREEIARRFRERYGSQGAGLDGEAQGNVAPTFIGVFDTVAALGSMIVRRILCTILLVSLGLAGLATWLGSEFWMWGALAPTALILLVLMSAVRRQFKFISKPPGGGRFNFHFAAWNLKHYDRFLDTNVGYARHALSIDENRARFPRVSWGARSDVTRKEALGVAWLDQVWFAGNHSDIGGSYPEAESRLSDIALAWMLKELAAIPDPPLINVEMIRTFPDPLALQHDEARASYDNWWPSWWPRTLRLGWKSETRAVHPEARLHESVLARFKADMVPQYDDVAPYRPPGLSKHKIASSFYP